MRNNEKCTFPLLAICKIDTIPYFATENFSDWTIIYKSSISSLSYQPRNYWVNSKYSIYPKKKYLKKFELSSQLNSAWLLWTVDAVLLPKVISCATFAPPLLPISCLLYKVKPTEFNARNIYFWETVPKKGEKFSIQINTR